MTNIRFPHACVISNEVADDDPFSTEAVIKVVLYNGVCRSFAKQVTSSEGKVITSTRCLSLPGLIDLPKTGDFVSISKGNIQEKGKILDVLPNNFGTEILWEYVRN